MRNILKTLLLGCLIPLMSSCGNDWLDLSPSKELPTAIAIQNYNDLKTALNGIYDALQEDPAYYGARMLYYGDVRGADMQASEESARSGSVYMMKYTADDAPQIWEAPYNVIRCSNNVIEAVHSGKITDAREADLKDVLGQALAIRALAHFDLVRVYGLPYVADQGASFGVPIITKLHDATFTVGRNTVAEVYQQVETDLLEAIDLMKAEKTKGYFNQWAAKALLARVYLYKGENAKALDFAKQVIDNSGYKLWTNAEYVNAWSQEGTSEVLFEIVNASTSDWVDRESIGYLMSESGYGDMKLTESFLNLLYKDPNDVRIRVTKRSSQDTLASSRKTYYLNKYPGRGDKPDVRVNNVPVLRLSEIYLTAAEAAVKLNDASADTYLNAIVLRANPSATPIQGATLDDVLLERRKELVGEGHGFFDAMRNLRTITRYTDKSDQGWHLTLPANARSFDYTFSRALLPIPKTECDVNPIIRNQQNPGYSVGSIDTK